MGIQEVDKDFIRLDLVTVLELRPSLKHPPLPAGKLTESQGLSYNICDALFAHMLLLLLLLAGLSCRVERHGADAIVSLIPGSSRTDYGKPTSSLQEPRASGLVRLVLTQSAAAGINAENEDPKKETMMVITNAN